MNEDKKQSFTEKITSNFLRGLLVIMPPVITIFVLKWLFELTERFIGRYMPVYMPGLGMILLIVAIWIERQLPVKKTD